MRIQEDQILSGVRHAQLSTWGNKYNPVTPSIKKENDVIIFSTADVQVSVDSFDEIILTIIIKFLFMPIWLIKQCYENGHVILGQQSIDDKINDWIKIGIVWKESSVTGQYVRPTYALFSLFGITPYPYTNIPFNTLTHTISEEKVMFDIMYGSSPIIEKEKIKIPRVSELGFPLNKEGTNVISEEDFRNPILYTAQGLKELERVENEINLGIKTKAKITPELDNFKYFVIAKKKNNTGDAKKDYIFHVPDLAIPLPRIDGKAKSVAIEVELTDKKVDYQESLNRYKDNNKFGVVYWLCNSNAIAQSLKTAYKEIGGTGSCRVVLQEFIIPSPDF